MPEQSNPFLGKTVVVTGKFIAYKRCELEGTLLAVGAIPVKNISRKTDYLIAGDNTGIKRRKAMILGIPTLSEDEFELMLSQTDAE